METRFRMPLHDLPLEQFLVPPVSTANKTPRKPKRPLSPSRTTPLNPAKRRVLDAESISLSNNVITSSPSYPTHTVTPVRSSRLGNGATRDRGSFQVTSSLLPSDRHSPSRELYPRPTTESSANPQSMHYPGFDIFRDSERRQGPMVSRVSLPSNSDAQVDRSDEDKENMPLRRKAKRKKHILSSLDGSGVSSLSTFGQISKVVRPERTPFSARQAPR